MNRLSMALVFVLAITTGMQAQDKPLASAVIVVDPGHGGQAYSKSYTGGTRGVLSKLTESELNLRVAFELEKKLKEAGATVTMTRVADHRLSKEGSSNTDELHARIDYFEHANPHFFLSVHHNAGKPEVTGHTTLYKHNAKDDMLYEQLATMTNDALKGAVPGPKLSLIKGSYHILRETDIPGTITESGFMSNKAFDELCNQPDFPTKEAAAIATGATRYWQAHKPALVTLRDKLAKERAAHPRDPKTITATALNTDYQAMMAKRLEAIAPGGNYQAEKAPEYLAKYKALVVTYPKAVFTVKAKYEDKVIVLIGETSDRKYHDQWIDVLVAMKLYAIRNAVVLPTVKK